MDAFARTDTRRRRVARATAAILALTALQFGLTMYGPGRQHVDSHGGPTSDAILVDVPVPESDLSSDTPPPALSPYLSRNARSLPLPARQVILPQEDARRTRPSAAATPALEEEGGNMGRPVNEHVRSITSRGRIPGLALVVLTVALMAGSPGAGGAAAPGTEPAVRGFTALDILPSWHLVAAGHGTSLDVVSDAVATGDKTMYMTGALGGATTGHDLSLTKCVRGQIVWSKTYDGPGHGYDAAIAVAARGRAIYTTGSRQSARGDGDLVLIRWNAAGDRVWTRSFDSGEHLSDGGIDVAVDAEDNVVVVGESEMNAGVLDAVVLKYTSAGRRLWVRRYDGAAHGPDLANRVVVDAAGRIYAAGWTESMTNEADTLVIKYSAAGKRLWTRRFNGSGDGRDELVALVARPGGGVYAAGTTIGATSGEDALLLAYTAAGKRSFVATATGMTGGTATAQGFNDLVVHKSGEVWCCGYDASGTVGTDCLGAAYNGTTGSPRRMFRESSPGVRDDRFGAIATDRLGGICITGRWATGATTSQTYTRRFADGGAYWTSFYPAAPTGLDGGACIVTHGVNAFVAGTHHDPATGYDQISLAFIY